MVGYTQTLVVGRLSSDPETKNTQSGDKIVMFSVVTSEEWKDKASGERKEKAEFHRVVVYNQMHAGTVERFLKKGSWVTVVGKNVTRKYNDRDGNERSTTEVIVGRFEGSIALTGPAPSRDDNAGAGSGGGQRSAPKAPPKIELNDEIPF